MTNELSPHIVYYPSGNVSIKGQKNSRGQRECLWEWFYENANIYWRTPYKKGKADGIQEGFYSNGNILCRTPYKGGKRDGIEEYFDEEGNIVETRYWKDGQIIKETEY